MITEGPSAKLWLALLIGSSHCTNRAETRAYWAPVHVPVLSVRLDLGTVILEVRERFVRFQQPPDHADVLIRHESSNAQRRI